VLVVLLELVVPVITPVLLIATLLVVHLILPLLTPLLLIIVLISVVLVVLFAVLSSFIIISCATSNSTVIINSKICSCSSDGTANTNLNPKKSVIILKHDCTHFQQNLNVKRGRLLAYTALYE
jgi:hypothetical protein